MLLFKIHANHRNMTKKLSTWWRHQMETLNFSHKSQWRGAFMISLICAWTNGWVNNRDAGDLRRYRVHCDITVMHFCEYILRIAFQLILYQELKSETCFIMWCYCVHFLPLTLWCLIAHLYVPVKWAIISSDSGLLRVRFQAITRINVSSLSNTNFSFRDSICLTHRPLVPHICVSELDQHWFR